MLCMCLYVPYVSFSFPHFVPLIWLTNWDIQGVLFLRWFLSPHKCEKRDMKNVFEETLHKTTLQAGFFSKIQYKMCEEKPCCREFYARKGPYYRRTPCILDIWTSNICHWLLMFQRYDLFPPRICYPLTFESRGNLVGHMAFKIQNLNMD